jgi:topoisomerase-4 subunit A
VHYLTANPNGEAEVITVKLTAGCTARKKVFDFDFSTLDIKGRGAGGNVLTKYPVRRVDLKSEGTSTLSGLDLWYDHTVGRLNKDERGYFIGKFNGEDRIVVFYKDGSYELTTYELTNRYEAEKIHSLAKLTDDLIINIVYLDGESKNHYVKRFQVETSTLDKKFPFISESRGSKLEVLSTEDSPTVNISYLKGKKKEVEQLNLKEFIDVKGWKTIGNKLPFDKVRKIELKNGKMDSVPDIGKKPEALKKEKPKMSKPSVKAKSDLPASKEEKKAPGFGVGETIEFDVPKQKEGDDEEQLDLF